jgi:hypothetical protein
MTKEQAKLVVTTFRLDPDVKEAAERYAKENHRSLNSAVNYLLARALIKSDYAWGSEYHPE